MSSAVILAITAVVLVSAIIGATRSEGPPRAEIDNLRFMAGSWTCEIWGGRFDETWIVPAAGTMQGVGRHVSDGKTGFMEFLSIEPVGDGLTMFILLGAPSKGAKTPVAFPMVELSPGHAVFERPANDYPKRLTYEAKDDGSLFCRIEGPKDGKPAHDDFHFKRVQ